LKFIFICFKSFSQNNSAIESVTFDTAEQLVAAGSAGGTIKLWDLDEQKGSLTIVTHDLIESCENL
jgi:katanin p80 WD40 repeat-containing subunit B1